MSTISDAIAATDAAVPPVVHPAPREITRVTLGDFLLTLSSSAPALPTEDDVDELATLLRLQSLLDRRRRELGYTPEGTSL